MCVIILLEPRAGGVRLNIRMNAEWRMHVRIRRPAAAGGAVEELLEAVGVSRV